MNGFKVFVILLVGLIILDFVWLGIVMKDFYNQQLGELARRQAGSMSPRWSAAILVYLLIPLGIVVFVRPLILDLPTWRAVLYGALYGLVVYGVYDLTNRAVLDQWSLTVTLVDICWGSFICGLFALVVRILH